MPSVSDELVSVRYMVDDVDHAIAFYTDNFDFELGQERVARVRRGCPRPAPTYQRVVARMRGRVRGHPMPSARSCACTACAT
jgi:catechol 2,3-dioxygenase-like lactoylglutathione lyase family enzyme